MKREVKIGVFAVVMVAAAWWGVKFLSGFDLFSRNNTYYAVFDNSHGLKQAATVMMYGVKVGSVTSIKIDQSRGKVIATLNVDKKFKVYQDSKAKVYSPSMMSSEAIEIWGGSGVNMLSNRDTITTEQGAGIMDMALSEVGVFKEQFTVIAEELTKTLQGVNALLESNKDNVDSTIANLNALSAQLNSIIRSQQSNIATTMDGVASLSENISRNSAQIDSIVNNVNLFTADLANAQIAATLAELNVILASLNSGGGTANLLLQDERLYESLVSSVGSLDSLLVDLNENPKRYVHFSLFGGRNKE